MRKAIKNKGKIVKAYCLGAGSAMEASLLTQGSLRIREDGTYELFSQEAKNGKGEIAYKGDYFKVDHKEDGDYPYPNSKAYFEANHRKSDRDADTYEQIPKPLEIWQAVDPVNDVISFLLERGRLTIKADDDKHYFNAFLWGTDLSAAKDATIVFYKVERDAAGMIADVDFNFVAKAEFERDYTVLG